ncbi:ABC transporter substrate-binding protein [Paenibacillus harenae]|uniref:ABC transporter substrate-binding protein n=1 Tax=Paenibacillus harenae TaxID=306543 RepID=UPI0004099AB5|nr:ABC transporter substrate-binding protein [Paenibacillus harenae]
MKKKLTMFLMLTLLIGLLAACGNSNTGSTGNNTSETDAASNQPSAPAEKVTLQFWHSMGGTNGERIDAMIKRFNESHENIEVIGTFQGGYDDTVTKLQQAVASGSAPDVSMLERAYVEMFADSEVLEDMKPYLEQSGISEDEFTEGLMGHSYFNDQLVSLPLNRSTPILHVNKTLLDEMGLTIPKTWEELEQTANALVVKENGEITRYGFSMPYDTWYPIAMISQAEGKFFNEDRTSIGFYDNGVGLKVFSQLKKLQETGALYYPPATDSGNIVNGMFKEGKVAMIYQSTGSIGGLTEAVDFDYATAFLPQDKVYANPTGGANVAMLAASKNKEAAWEFIRWMETDPQGALPFILESGYLPFTKSMVESQEIKDLWAKEPNRKVAYDQLQYAVDTNNDVTWPEVMHEFFSAIEAIMYDSKDIQATLDTFKKEAERILAD